MCILISVVSLVEVQISIILSNSFGYKKRVQDRRLIKIYIILSKVVYTIDVYHAAIHEKQQQHHFKTLENLGCLDAFNQIFRIKLNKMLGGTEFS